MIQDAAGQRFGYDAEGRQTQFFSANNSTQTPDATYSFDGDGKRIKKVSATENTIFVYDAGGQLVEEYASGTVQTSYVYAGSTLLTTETASGTNYLTADHLGSPRIVTDASGNVTSRKDYTAFGEETTTAQRTTGLGYSPQNVRQDYTGYQKDNESGLEYAQARYYNSLHGRFTSPDPLTASATIRDPQTFNRYSYGLNSPYKFTDPLGLIYWEASGACGSTCPGSNYGGPGGGGGLDMTWVPDATLDWIPEIIQNVVARSEGPDRKPTDLTPGDREALQKNLQKIAPGTRVTKAGRIIAARGSVAGSQLLFGIAEAGLNVTIVVNHRGVLNTGPVTDKGKINFNGYAPNIPSAAEVLWDPNVRPLVYVRTGRGKHSHLIASDVDPDLTLGHELVHAYNQIRLGEAGFRDLGDHKFNDGDATHMETWYIRELRAVGLGPYNKAGDITENDLRKQLGQPLRATYLGSRQDWRTCGDSGLSLPC